MWLEWAVSLPTGAEIGPNHIGECVGLGEMASVYKARYAALDRFVAIKLLPEFFADDDGSRSASGMRGNPMPRRHY